MEAERRVSGWAIAGITFAAAMLFVVGVFQVIAGLVAIFNDEFYVVAPNYTFDLDVSAWGWIHLLLGAFLLISPAGGSTRARPGRRGWRLRWQL